MNVTGVEAPPGDATLWRYMSFAKFCSLVSSETLWLNRIDRFGGDRMEGTIPAAAHPSYAGLIEAHQKNRKRLFVSCWHENAGESSLMWQAYSTGDLTVAIETTASDLVGSLRAEDEAFTLGRIRYIDYEKEVFSSHRKPEDNYMLPAFHKRHYFKGEAEVRLVANILGASTIRATNGDHAGYDTPIDVAMLIRRVWLPPAPAPWTRKVVEHIASSAGAGVEVVESGI